MTEDVWLHLLEDAMDEAMLFDDNDRQLVISLFRRLMANVRALDGIT